MDPTSQGCDELGDSIVIGAILPLSSPGAMRSGFAMQTALNIAVNDINAVGGVQGRQIELVTYDSAGIPSRGAKFAERLILHDCARAIVGLYHNNVAIAVRDVAATYGIPLILAEPNADGLTGKEAAELFRIVPAKSMVDSMDARWLAEVGDYNQDGELTAVVIAADTSHGQEQAEQAGYWMPEFGIDVKTLVADLPTQDFSPVIARIVDMEMAPDALFIKVRGEPALAIQRQLLDAGIGPDKGTIIVTDEVALDDEHFWAVMPDGAGTVVKQIGPWPSTATALGHLFAVSYMRTFERWPERYAFAAYDALMLAADAMERSTTLTPPDILAALAAADIELAAGRYYFLDGEEDASSHSYVSDLLWGQWPDVQTLFLEYKEPLQPAEQMSVIWPDLYRTVDTPFVH